ncbi:MAG: aryl-sulfate sulfotransferase [Deltaproteobacteria bacterium]|nr:aryl-sulfate sulfotransferase [Deltaproteobacteria bacterium]
MQASCPCPWPLLLLLTACGDDLPSGNDGSSGDTASAQTGDSTAEPATTNPVDTDADSTSTTGTPLSVEHEVVTYPAQPMVADLVLHVSQPASATVSHPDPGVVIASQPSEKGTLRFRLRGMLPATTHAIDYTVSTENDEVGDTVDIDLPAALPGFQAAFSIETTGIDPLPHYRLFDQAPFPITGATGLFMVDTAGITRWYLGAVTKTTNADAIWAAAKLLDDGSVLYLVDNGIWRRDELGEIVWELSAESLGIPSVHHEVMLLPNGNLLTLGLAFEDIDYPEDGTVHVAGDTVLEITPEGEIVWEWNSFDHLDPLRVRDGFQIPIFDPATGQVAQDWTHANGMVYEPDTDTVLVSLRHQDWILRIDHATGELVWRLGPEGDFTLDQGRWFFHQHSPQWQPDGSLLLYDNGVGDPDLPDDQEFSRAVRYTIDDDMGVASEVWSDEGSVAPFNSALAGDADYIGRDRLQVVDSFIVAKEAELVPFARIRELAAEGDATPVWTLQTNPGHFVYRSTTHDRLVGVAAR